MERQGRTHVDVSVGKYGPNELLRLYRLGRELRLTDQILSTDLDTVSIVDDGPAPAWTTLDGDHVSFALKFMPRPETRADVAVWMGTNAHELGHVLYSPRRNSVLMARVIEGETIFMRGLKDIHNIVEDQRQERLLLGRFAPWRGYLTAALGHHLVADSSNAWLLMAGRTWLPDQVRASARAAFVVEHDESMAAEVARLVGEYQRLVDPGDTESDEAWEVLVRLHSLFELDMPKLKHQCVVMGAGEPVTSEAGEGAPMTADEADDETGRDGPAARPGQGKDDSRGEGQAEAEGEGQDEGKDDREGQGQGAGTESGKPDFDQADARRQLRSGAAEQMEADEEAQDDLDSVLDALAYGRAGNDGAEGREAFGQNHEVTDAARRLHHEVGDALLDLKDQSEPGWLKRVDSGRLNVRRLADPFVDSDELFDRYEPGQMDASELELVLLLDVSSSMSHQTWPLAEATWAVRQAVDDIEGTATVITFESGPHMVLAEPGVRPDDRMFVPAAMGGTDPESALREAFRLLADSQARNRLMVVLTDGQWANGEACERLIGALNEVGVSTVLAQLDDNRYPSGLNAHGCRFAEKIGELTGLALLFRRVAAAQIGAWR